MININQMLLSFPQIVKFINDPEKLEKYLNYLMNSASERDVSN